MSGFASQRVNNLALTRQRDSYSRRDWLVALTEIGVAHQIAVAFADGAPAFIECPADEAVRTRSEKN
jgi:hypothetical protein